MRTGVICAAALAGLTVTVAAADEPPPDRVKVVRQMYEKVPPLILQVAEPIVLADAEMRRDGGTTVVVFKDARDQSVSFRLDRGLASPTRGSMFVKDVKGSERPILPRGPEEAALYGLLIRWQPAASTPAGTLVAVRNILAELDRRFAGGAGAAAPERVVVETVTAIEFAIEKRIPPNLVITAVGAVPASGFTAARLNRVVYAKPPADGIQEYYLTAVPTGEASRPAAAKVEASDTWTDYQNAAPWLRGVRVYGAGGGVLQKRLDGKR